MLTEGLRPKASILKILKHAAWVTRLGLGPQRGFDLDKAGHHHVENYAMYVCIHICTGI